MRNDGITTGFNRKHESEANRRRCTAEIIHGFRSKQGHRIQVAIAHAFTESQFAVRFARVVEGCRKRQSDMRKTHPWKKSECKPVEVGVEVRVAGKIDAEMR